MSAPPFMPFYVGDYLADTTHLTVTEHGAYLLLLMSMWRNGGSLPGDDKSLARHARCTRGQWERMRPVLMPFFHLTDTTITQARLASELTKHSEAVRQQRERSSNGGKAKALKTNGSALPAAPVRQCQPEPEPYKTPKAPKGAGVDAEAVEAIWSAQPSTGGKRKATRPDVADALDAAIKRGGKAGDIVLACRAYYALPDNRREDGRFSKGAAVLLAKDRWKDFLPRPTPPVVADPALYLERVRHWEKTSEWRPEWGQKPRRAA